MPGDKAKLAHTVVKRVLSTLLYISDINECHERTNGCHQQCVNTNGSYVCACRTGYRLIADGYTCIGRLDKLFILMHNRFTKISDVDECSEELHRCHQTCHNSVGSYACSCDSGYRLDGDGLTCNGRFP